MSLSDRLRAAERQRRVAAGLDPDAPPARDRPTLDLTGGGAPVVDLEERRVLRPASAAPLGPGPVDAGISYDPVRDGDASRAYGTESESVVADRASAWPCPRCGSATQIDLFDQVHQSVSLSCTRCFHMFRVEIDDEA